jgi:hypothetical protein
MPLLYFLGVTSINTSFSASFTFLLGEKQEDYNFTIYAFKRHILRDPNINYDVVTLEVIITDNETALKNSFVDLLPVTPQLLYFWHVQKNLLIKI